MDMRRRRRCRRQSKVFLCLLLALELSLVQCTNNNACIHALSSSRPSVAIVFVEPSAAHPAMHELQVQIQKLRNSCRTRINTKYASSLGIS
ncbi:hypothetical protein F4777DRAFT_537132 [Nemania sp. FL0916]|nr:hypothetical protein F4777DRAFT_537132 [Nemania sp. FL0916]